MKLLVAFLFAVGLLTCSDDKNLDYSTPACEHNATVLEPLDGCGILLQLSDGKLLMPLRLTYVQAPSPEDDPIYHYQLRAGEKVLIGYRDVKDGEAGVCMAGEDLVFITCIRSAEEK